MLVLPLGYEERESIEVHSWPGGWFCRAFQAWALSKERPKRDPMRSPETLRTETKHSESSSGFPPHLRIGRVSSATSFDPKYAAIIQNKDELTIPLNLSTIPSPKEFKDAIETLRKQMKFWFRVSEFDAIGIGASKYLSHHVID